MKLTLRQRINKADAMIAQKRPTTSVANVASQYKHWCYVKKDREIALKDFNVNVSMICQVVYHSKAAIALNRYTMI